MRSTIGMVTLVAVLLLVPAVSAEQAPGGDSFGELREELRSLNGALGQIAILMQQLVQQQRTDTLLRRVEMKERRLVPLESRLRGGRAEIAELEAGLADFQERRDQWESEVRDREAGEAEAIRNELQMIAQEERRMQGQLDARRRTVSELELDLDALEKQIRILEDQLEESVGD